MTEQRQRDIEATGQRLVDRLRNRRRVASGGEGLLRRLIVMGLDESALLAAARLALVLDAGASQQEGE